MGEETQQGQAGQGEGGNAQAGDGQLVAGFEGGFEFVLESAVVAIGGDPAAVDRLRLEVRDSGIEVGAHDFLFRVFGAGHGTISTAVQATQRGAFDFLEKPLDADRLLLTVRNAMRHANLSFENERLKGDLDTDYPKIGSSEVLRTVRELTARVAPTDAAVPRGGRP